MLTRLRVAGFKNLDPIDVRFGPFTCLAGPNGVGKSNVFDAISFLAALADKPLVEAALAVRGADGRKGDSQSLFRRVGDKATDHMSFLAEMIIQKEGEDPLGQKAEASMTYLRYELELGYRPDSERMGFGLLEVLRESLVHINRSEAKAELRFPHSKPWRESVVTGRRTSPYISTESSGGLPMISLHADSVGGMGGGRPRVVPASKLPRTMLSSVNNATEHRTLVLARREMASWMQLQLEPSALRAPDGFSAPRNVGQKGDHLPATLHGLALARERERQGGADDLYAEVANRLSQLVEDVRRITVDVDERRQLMSVSLTDRHGTQHAASALSDGTLRFLALTVMEADPGSGSLLCLEEPENGMHPLRIRAVIELLKDLAVDPTLPIGPDNPLRQVIVNTHSPSVVACVDDGDLLVAHAGATTLRGANAPSLSLRSLPGTWRTEPGNLVTRGELLAYLNPLAALGSLGTSYDHHGTRVMDREDIQLCLPLRSA